MPEVMRAVSEDDDIHCEATTSATQIYYLIISKVIEFHCVWISHE